MPYRTKSANKISYEQAFAKDKEGLTKKYGSKEGFIKAAKSYNKKTYGTTEPTKASKDLGISTANNNKALAAKFAKESKVINKGLQKTNTTNVNTKATTAPGPSVTVDPRQSQSAIINNVVTKATDSNAGAKDKMSRKQRRVGKLETKLKNQISKVDTKFKEGKDVSQNQARIKTLNARLRKKQDGIAGDTKSTQPSTTQLSENKKLKQAKKLVRERKDGKVVNYAENAAVETGISLNLDKGSTYSKLLDSRAYVKNEADQRGISVRKLKKQGREYNARQQQANTSMTNNNAFQKLDEEAAALGSKKLGTLMKPANYMEPVNYMKPANMKKGGKVGKAKTPKDPNQKADLSALGDVNIQTGGVADAYVANASNSKTEKTAYGS